MALRVPRRVIASLFVVLCWTAEPQHAFAQGCTITWDGGGGTIFWQSRFNWNPDRLPTNGDVACIGVPTVTLSDFGFHHISKVISTGGLTVSGSILQLDAGGSLGGALSIVSSGQVDNRGPLSVGGLLTINGSSLNGSGTTTAMNGIAFQGLVDTFSHTLNNEGTATFVGSSTRVRMPGGTFNNRPGAAFNAADGVGFDSIGVSATFNNQGTFAKDGSSSFSQTAFGGVRFINTGTLDIRKGSLRFTTTWSQTQGTTLLTAGTILESVAPVQLMGGALSGSGTVKGDLALSGSGSVLPGGFGVVGELFVTGNYSQVAGTTLAIEIAGTAASAFDRLRVTGTATLGGNLASEVLGAFKPATGDRFQLLTFATGVGAFDVVHAPGFVIERNPTDVTLVAAGPTCSFDIDPSSKAFPVQGGIDSVAVRTDPGCEWTVVKPAELEWITIISGAAGTGPGTVRYSVTSNIGPEREATFTIAGKPFKVTQAPCTYEISPSEKAFEAEGGTDFVEVTTPGACGWGAASLDETWLSITSGRSGSGDGVVTYSVASNEGPKREGTLVIAGHSFIVRQAGPKPVLNLTKFEPVQVVYGASALVQGKPMALALTVTATNPEELPDGGIDIKVLLEGRTELANIPKVDISSGTARKIINPADRFRPQQHPLFVEVHLAPSGKLDDPGETKKFRTTDGIPAFSKPILTVAFVPIIGCDREIPCYTGPSAITPTLEGSRDYLSATYPVPGVDLRKPETESIIGAPFRDEFPGHDFDARDDDLVQLGQLAKRLGVQRVVGVVGDAYMVHHRVDAAGFARPGPRRTSEPTAPPAGRPNGRGVVVVEGRLSTVAHELGHTYDLDHPCESGSGYWVERDRAIDDAPCYMLASSILPLEASGLWIGLSAYEILLGAVQSALQGPEAAAGSEVLEVAFTIDKTDAVTLKKWYFNLAGEAVSIEPGEYAMKVLDANGTVLASTTFAPDFRFFSGDVTEEVNTASVLLSVPYPKTAAMLQIVKGTAVLLTIVPQTKLLKDSLNSIPDVAFVELPTERRRTLVGEVDAAERALLLEDFVGARTLLQTLRQLMRQWIKDDYPVINSLQVKSGELSLIVEDTVLRVELIGGPLPRLACDVDADRDVDVSDLQLIRAAAGRKAQADDPRDANGDGRINVADVRFCTLRCTLASCVVPISGPNSIR